MTEEVYQDCCGCPLWPDECHTTCRKFDTEAERKRWANENKEVEALRGAHDGRKVNNE